VLFITANDAVGFSRHGTLRKERIIRIRKGIRNPDRGKNQVGLVPQRGDSIDPGFAGVSPSKPFQHLGTLGQHGRTD
jgi:hypothetical protein